MKRKISDERVDYSKLITYKFVVYIISLFLIMSLVQKLILQQNFSNYITELISLLVIFSIIIMRNTLVGNYLMIQNSTMAKIVVIILCSCVSTFIIVYNNYQSNQHYQHLTYLHLLSMILGNLFVQLILMTIIVKLLNRFNILNKLK